MKKVELCDSCHNRQCLKERELNILLDITSMLSGKEVDLNAVIDMLAEHLNVERLYLTLFNRKSGHIKIEEAYGISLNDMKSGVYHVGEGVIGRVIERGEEYMISDISESQEFLNRTKSPMSVDGAQTAFVCIPVKYKDEVIGTISLHKMVKDPTEVFDNEVRILKITAGLIGRALRRRQEYAEEMERLQSENDILRDNISRYIAPQPENIKGKSGKLSDMFSLIDSVAKTDATVIIRGESGVGKELVADAVHNASNRRERPLIKVNCAALPDSLIESELFGHEKGSFTGATQRHIGRFEAANGGTIFLDEFGDMPASTQVKLLRVLQEREIQRLGSSETIKVDVRVLCATNRDLEKMISEGDFREDLYYRINVFPIYIPPLRERLSDIPVLVDHFIEKYNKRYDKSVKRITSMAIDQLMFYNWPGNIRELENCVERACILASDGVIRVHNLPPTLQTGSSSHTLAKGSLDEIMGRLEKQVIVDALTSSKGNIAKAAESLSISERVMGLRIAKYEIDPKRYKISSTYGRSNG